MLRTSIKEKKTFTSMYHQASYALGYNLAIEYLADYEKTWALDSFRTFDKNVLQALGKKVRKDIKIEGTRVFVKRLHPYKQERGGSLISPSFSALLPLFPPLLYQIFPYNH
jgi:hypothetical protein